jgi:hypothetical protein
VSHLVTRRTATPVGSRKVPFRTPADVGHQAEAHPAGEARARRNCQVLHSWDRSHVRSVRRQRERQEGVLETLISAFVPSALGTERQRGRSCKTSFG